MRTTSALSQDALPRLTQGADIVQVPGVGRVVLVFVVVAALAVAVALVLRRVLPRLPGGYAPDSRIKMVGRSTPSAGVRVHLLQIDEQRVLLAENRSGLSMVVLPPDKESSGA